MNRLPEVKRFLKDPGHADAYPSLVVTWMAGRNPDLLLKAADGTVVEMIDLSTLNTEQIHKILVEKGLERNAKGAKAKFTGGF